MKTRISTLCLAAAALTATSAVCAEPSVQIKLNFPAPGQAVGLRTCFAGTVSDPNAKVVLVIRPTAISSFFVQPPVEVRPDGSFFVVGYVGEAGGQFTGTRYIARAYAFSGETSLREGDELPEWPRGAQALSVPLEFSRSTADSTDCPEETGSSTASARVNPTTAGHSSVSPSVVQNSAIDPDEPISGHQVGRWLALVLCVLLGMLSAVSEYRTKTVKAMKSAIGGLWAWLIEAFSRATSPLNDDRCTAPEAPKEVDYGEYARGARRYVRNVQISPVMAVCLVVAIYADALAIAPGLRLIFPAVSGFGLFGGTITDTASSITNPHLPFIVAMIIDQLANLLRNEPYALALALAQAAIGCCMLRGIESSATVLSPWALFRARPLACPAFVLFTVALAVIAFNRGHEMTRTGPWLVPAVVAALLAVTMPWASTFALNTFIDSVARILAPVLAVLAYGSSVVSPVIWVRLWGAVWMLPVGAMLLCAMAVCGAILVYVEVAGLIGAFLEKIYRLLYRKQPAEEQNDDVWERKRDRSFGD